MPSAPVTIVPEAVTGSSTTVVVGTTVVPIVSVGVPVLNDEPTGTSSELLGASTTGFGDGDELSSTGVLGSGMVETGIAVGRLTVDDALTLPSDVLIVGLPVRAGGGASVLTGEELVSAGGTLFEDGGGVSTVLLGALVAGVLESVPTGWDPIGGAGTSLVAGGVGADVEVVSCGGAGASV